MPLTNAEKQARYRAKYKDVDAAKQQLMKSMYRMTQLIDQLEEIKLKLGNETENICGNYSKLGNRR